MSDYNYVSSNVNFPDPLANHAKKVTKEYGLQYAKGVYSQWGGVNTTGSLYNIRWKEFQINRDYANGTQDTNIYKQILTSLDPNNGDGALLSIDWSPVPIIPKFVKIVVNKILGTAPFPNVEAIDPISQTEKDRERAKINAAIKNKEMFAEAKQLGLKTVVDPDALPETTEEAEIFFETSIKTQAEIAAQIATRLTLSWNDFNEKIYRRNVQDLVEVGMAVVKRNNDPNYGIKEDYVDPAYFIHSITDDPNLSDCTYVGHIKNVSIQELKRMAGTQFTEDQYKQMAYSIVNSFGNNPDKLSEAYYDSSLGVYQYGYDQYTVPILEFEFLSVDDIVFEKKESRFGNIGFYYKGYEYKAPSQSVYDREPVHMQNATIYGGKYIVGTEFLFDYGLKKNIPKNIHDLSRARFSYSAIAVNLRRMIPKSLVGSVITFADQIQITHLKLQQSIAKAKPDGLIVDIEGLENVQLGRGGELQPLEIQDIYEQTGVFYYRSKNADGGFQNPPIRTLENGIRNINELITIYNHALRMIRDATGINEVMDGTSPKGEQLVGVREQAIQASNNALYDITNASMVLFRKVCEDIVKCLQILPPQSVVFKAYENAVGMENMKVLSSFKDLPMYNFGVRVVTEMNDRDRAYLEANIQAALSIGEINLEDAIAIRQLRDVDQAERLLVVRRKKRIREKQEQSSQNSQMQAQMNIQTAQASSQGKIEELNVGSQVELVKIQADKNAKLELLDREYALKMELERLKLGVGSVQQQSASAQRAELETEKEDRKDERVKKQAIEQSKLISQRKGERPELTEEQEDDVMKILLGE
jgi:hypothetical protein